MPTSHFFQLNEIIEVIFMLKPKKLLDIGIGFGKYGFLAREYLELWDGREQYSDWQTQIDGIEIHEKYVRPLQKEIYDSIFIGNALELLPDLKDDYDLILMIDVFEHFNYADGIKMLEVCSNKCSNLLISVPLNVTPQGAAFGNEHETHRHAWKREDFTKFNSLFVNNPRSLIAVINFDEK